MVEPVISDAVKSADLAPNPAFPKAEVVARRDITDDLMVIKLEPEESGSFNFKPGQYCTLGLGSIERAYSIASAPHEKTIEVFVELVPDGELTPLMWRLRPGDAIPSPLLPLPPSPLLHPRILCSLLLVCVSTSES